MDGVEASDGGFVGSFERFRGSIARTRKDDEEFNVQSAVAHLRKGDLASVLRAPHIIFFRCEVCGDIVVRINRQCPFVNSLCQSNELLLRQIPSLMLLRAQERATRTKDQENEWKEVWKYGGASNKYLSI